MKNLLTGILSAVLLLAVLIGNAAFAAVDSGEKFVVETAAKAEESVELPVLMYHHILRQESRLGDYVISPDQFEADLLAIQQKGYTTISATQLLDYMDGKNELPDKPILITFDDGYESFYEYAFPLLQKYNMKAVVSIIGKYTDLYSGDVVKNVSYSHINWTQLKEVQESGLVEVGNHTYELHSNDTGKRKGIQKLSSESEEEYQSLLTADIGSLNEEIKQELSASPTVFAYPFGAFSEQSGDILKGMGFRIILTCEEKVNHLDRSSYQEGDVIKLKRFNRASSYSTESYFKKLK